MRAVSVLGAQMNISRRVLPATLESVHLEAVDDGGDVRGESAIAARRGCIRRFTLERPVRPAVEYEADGSQVVRPDGTHGYCEGVRVLTADFAALSPGGQIRHNPVALGAALTALVRARGHGSDSLA